MTKLNQLVGKVLRKDAEMFIVFRVRGRYYPATESNASKFEAYLKTGDEVYLEGLEHEVET